MYNFLPFSEYFQELWISRVVTIKVAYRVIKWGKEVDKTLPGGQLTELTDPQKRQQKLRV